jgi:methylmalonyl-CoA/ethylmalonyl-CoA epimerase
MLGDVVNVCLAVKNLEAAVNHFEKVFDLKLDRYFDSEQFGYRGAILKLSKGIIELMEPTNPDSAIAKFIDKQGEGVYLISFEVKDVPTAANVLRQKHIRVTLEKPKAKVAWIHPKDAYGMFMELLEPGEQL